MDGAPKIGWNIAKDFCLKKGYICPHYLANVSLTRMLFADPNYNLFVLSQTHKNQGTFSIIPPQPLSKKVSPHPNLNSRTVGFLFKRAGEYRK